MQLTSPMPRPWARRIGATTVALLALGTGFAVWSAQPARAPQAAANPAIAGSHADAVDVYHVVFDLKSDEQPPTRIEAGGLFGSPLDLKYRDGRGNEILVGGQIRRAGADRYDVALVLQRNGKVVAKPKLIVARDEQAAVKVGEEGADGRFQGIALSMRIDDHGTPPHILNMVNAPKAMMPLPVAAVAPLAISPPPSPPSPPAAPDAVPPPPPVAPAARPARLPSSPSPAPPAPPSPPSPPDPPSASSATRSPERAQQAVRFHAEQAEKARAEAVAAQTAAARHAAQSNPDFEAGRATAREAARAAAAARDAEEAARAAKAIAFPADPEAAEREQARFAAMSPEQRMAELEAMQQRIERRRAELRAAAAARARESEQGTAPTPAAN